MAGHGYDGSSPEFAHLCTMMMGLFVTCALGASTETAASNSFGKQGAAKDASYTLC